MRGPITAAEILRDLEHGPERALRLEAEAIERQAAPEVPGWGACDQAAALARELESGLPIARCECGVVEVGHRRVFHVKGSGACTVLGCDCKAYRPRGDR